MTQRVLGVAIGACLLGGCGGDDGSESGGSLSKDEYQERFVLIAEEEFSSKVKPLPGGTEAPLPEQGRFMKRVFELQERMGERLAQLDPPDEIEEAHDGYVETLLRATEEGAPLVEGLVRKDPTAIQEFIGNADPDELEKLTRFQDELERLEYDEIADALRSSAASAPN